MFTERGPNVLPFRQGRVAPKGWTLESEKRALVFVYV